MRKIFLLILFLCFYFSLSSTVHAVNKIKIRPGQQSEEFYDSATGERFYPRGHNYIVLGKTYSIFSPDPETHLVMAHVQFDSGVYNSQNAEKLLSDFEAFGYNTIRFFVSTVTIGNPNGSGLSSAFMDNIADFIKRAGNHHIYVLPVLHTIPEQGDYYLHYHEIAEESQMDSYNIYLMNQIFIDRKKQYVTEFIQQLKSRQVPLSNIFAYEIGNEIVFTYNDRPFKGVTSIVHTAAGDFNFSDPAQIELAKDKNIYHWTKEISNAIKTIDPGALVTLSFGDPVYFLELEAYRGTINPGAVFTKDSPLDFFSIHLYQLLGSIDLQLPRYKIDPASKKPLVMGEFGVENAHPLSQAVNDLKNWQVNSCKNFLFQGWLTWYWPKPDTIIDPNLNFWAADESNNAINQVLAPIYRSDPCQLQNITPTPTRIPTLIPTPTPTFNPCSASIKRPLNCPCEVKIQCASLTCVSDKCVPAPTITPTNLPTSIPTSIPTLPPSLCSPCPNLPQAKSKGDSDCSGTTTLNDYSIWRSEYVSSNKGILSKNSWRSDYNCDGKTNLIDYTIWKVNFIKSL